MFNPNIQQENNSYHGLKTQSSKAQLQKRYCCLYENSLLLYSLLSLTEEPKSKEFSRISKNMQQPSLKSLTSHEVLILIEALLLGDNEETKEAYNFIENLKSDKASLELIKLLLVTSIDQTAQIKFYTSMVLRSLYFFIEVQVDDVKNRDRKLTKIKEYYRFVDYVNHKNRFPASARIVLRKHYPLRHKKDIGIANNDFINSSSELSEPDLQAVYLKYHDELPWNLSATCSNEPKIPFVVNNPSCGKNYIVEERKIFAIKTDQNYDFYCLCSNCGKLNIIPGSLLSAGIKQRIIERSNNNGNIVRKLQLIAELISLYSQNKDGNQEVVRSLIMTI